jgi:hypothetical protein
MLTRLGSLIIWLALILGAVMDFTGTVLLCFLTVGTVWSGWYLSETIALIQDRSVPVEGPDSVIVRPAGRRGCSIISDRQRTFAQTRWTAE